MAISRYAAEAAASTRGRKNGGSCALFMRAFPEGVLSLSRERARSPERESSKEAALEIGDRSLGDIIVPANGRVAPHVGGFPRSKTVRVCAADRVGQCR